MEPSAIQQRLHRSPAIANQGGQIAAQALRGHHTPTCSAQQWGQINDCRQPTHHLGLAALQASIQGPCLLRSRWLDLGGHQDHRRVGDVAEPQASVLPRTAATGKFV